MKIKKVVEPLLSMTNHYIFKLISLSLDTTSDNNLQGEKETNSLFWELGLLSNKLKLLYQNNISYYFYQSISSHVIN